MEAHRLRGVSPDEARRLALRDLAQPAALQVSCSASR
jgi:hypothetical protein